MTAEDPARSYFAAWNARDPDAIAATLVPNGSYSDPSVPDGVPPEGLAGYAGGLFAAFPDLAFEIDEPVAVAGDRVMARWIMTGTNSGSFMGLPPTGRTVRVEGVDVIEIEGDRVRSVAGYFDGGSTPRQLGLQVIVQPASIGPFVFGTSTYASRSPARPGAVSLTVLEARSPEEIGEVRSRTREIVAELMGTDGFISFLGVVAGSRMFTISAWESVDDVGRLRDNAAHREAMERLFGPDIASGAQTGVWKPERLNGMWVRCAACGTMALSDGVAPCATCGAPATEPPAYW